MTEKKQEQLVLLLTILLNQVAIHGLVLSAVRIMQKPIPYGLHVLIGVVITVYILYAWPTILYRWKGKR